MTVGCYVILLALESLVSEQTALFPYGCHFCELYELPSKFKWQYLILLLESYVGDLGYMIKFALLRRLSRSGTFFLLDHLSYWGILSWNDTPHLYASYFQVCCSYKTSKTNPPITNRPTTSSIDIFAYLNKTDGTKGSETDITSPNVITTDRRDINDGPQDVTDHPNLRLLPRNCGSIDSNRILGGNRTQLYEMPWMVILSYDAGTKSINYFV